MTRAAIFIDGAYVDFVLKEEFGGVHINYAAFIQSLTPTNAELLRAYYYTCPPHVSDPPTDDERTRQQGFDRFKYALERIPRTEVRLGKLARRTDAAGNVRYEQKRVDLLIGIDVARLASKQQIQELVLVAGDSDFVPAIQVAKDEGVLARVWHGRSPHRELIQVADEACQFDPTLIGRVTRSP